MVAGNPSLFIKEEQYEGLVFFVGMSDPLDCLLLWLQSWNWSNNALRRRTRDWSSSKSHQIVEKNYWYTLGKKSTSLNVLLESLQKTLTLVLGWGDKEFYSTNLLMWRRNYKVKVSVKSYKLLLLAAETSNWHSPIIASQPPLRYHIEFTQTMDFQTIRLWQHSKYELKSNTDYARAWKSELNVKDARKNKINDCWLMSLYV